ncbi:hypothetical protein GE061_005746 [Apolygus lucorum]|uniref:hydroxyisourate hydrolase n=1 Tax=Apolygus lucorum TaxID=248454 RepID=A0A8S9WYV5_APOLU|nr:hypothetical protein GE061_005746 [Apolygus lucorum]
MSAAGERLQVISQHLSVKFTMASNVVPITCHVLDTSSGFPADGLSVTLYKMAPTSIGNEWLQINKDITNSDGRLPGFTEPGSITSGVHKMRFETGQYFASKGTKTFYPYVEIVFNIDDGNEHYHVPLLLIITSDPQHFLKNTGEWDQVVCMNHLPVSSRKADPVHHIR